MSLLWSEEMIASRFNRWPVLIERTYPGMAAVKNFSDKECMVPCSGASRNVGSGCSLKQTWVHDWTTKTQLFVLNLFMCMYIILYTHCKANTIYVLVLGHSSKNVECFS